MCLTYPVKIISVDNGLAKAEGKSFDIKTALVPNLAPGDWVLVNADLALKKISGKEAEEIKKYYEK
ncbi:MAG: HypC/HybG/HupF family hydrogenase formation chaperone [Patescibacteria group bacterium]